MSGGEQRETEQKTVCKDKSMGSLQGDADLEIEKRLRRIRYLRMSLAGLFVGILPVFCLVGRLKAPDALYLILALAYFFTWTVLCIVHGLVRCPVCDKLFNIRWPVSNPFTSKCMNCRASLKDGSGANMYPQILNGDSQAEHNTTRLCRKRLIRAYEP